MGGRKLDDAELAVIQRIDKARHYDIMRNRAYRAEHIEELRAKAAAERAKHPEYYRSYYAQKKREQRAREASAANNEKSFTPEEIESMREWDAKINKEESQKRAAYQRAYRKLKKARAATQADANGTANIITNEMEEIKNEV